mgnify:CR=1 FL=1
MIPFIDLKAQRQKLGGGFDAAITRVIDHGKFILGPEVAAFENELAAYCGVTHCVSCGNGTDALVLALMACDLGPDDVVIVPAMTFVASAEAVALVGATPFFCDVDADTFNVGPQELTEAIKAARKQGFNPTAAIIVDLFGLPAMTPELSRVAEEAGILIISDAAQSIGGRYDDLAVGSLSAVTATSFFPAKPLGCYGDGGAVFSHDENIAGKLRSLRVHGKGIDKYHAEKIGMNSRLDTMQAAILSEKLKIFPEEVEARQIIAQRYIDGLGADFKTQMIPEKAKSAWAYFTIMAPDRQTLRDRLTAAGIPTQVYYPVPLHELGPYRQFPRVSENLKNCNHLSQRSLSLPMHPYLSEALQSQIIEVVNGQRTVLDAQ